MAESERIYYIGDSLPAWTGTVTDMPAGEDLTGYAMTGRLARLDDTSQAKIDVDARCSIVSEGDKTIQVALVAADITVVGKYQFRLRFTSGTDIFTLDHPLRLDVRANPFA